MKKGTVFFLRTLIVLIGVATLALLLWEPHFEGRNANATFFEVYFDDPFLAYAYFASIFFFVALRQAFNIVGYAGQNKLATQTTVNAFKTIKRCAQAIIAFVVGAMVFLFVIWRAEEDIAGGIAMGLMLILGSTVVAVTAAAFQKRLQKKVV